MASIQVHQLSFTYPGSYTPVFQDLSFSMDSAWRLGLVGRNGRGKTTLLRLLAGELKGRGEILTTLQFDLFPFEAPENSSALHAMREAVAPFHRWEKEMARLLKENTKEALMTWGEIEHRYSAADGYVIDQLLTAEMGKLGMGDKDFSRPFLSFSPGERTRMMLAALFLRKNRFLLIDEPTNHLDMAGREIVGDYLAGKRGFLLVSHDRAFLDRSVDHIMALQKNSVVIQQGNYQSYRDNKEQQDAFERKKNEQLSRDIRRLQESGREKAQWSDKVEAGKIGQGVSDRGYVGARSARMMKRSLNIVRRIEQSVEEKEGLLKDLEYTAPISLHPLRHPSRQIIKFEKLCFGYGDRLIFDGLDLSIQRGERVALTGGNGAGKSTLMKLMLGTLKPLSGLISMPQDLIISSLPQALGQVRGSPYDVAGREGLDTSYFLTLLRKFDFPREAFDRDAAGFSMGQQKKLMLAASMAKEAHLYLWDEPLNYIDVESREQIEEMLMSTDATMVFVEHDRRFADKVATRVIALP